MTRFPDETIQIKHPLSLNKWIDDVAMPERNGDLVKLTNYIPQRGSLETRKGIEPLLHTAQVT